MALTWAGEQAPATATNACSLTLPAGLGLGMAQLPRLPRVEILIDVPEDERKDAGGAPIVASLAPSILPRSNFTAGFLAMLLTVKCADGLPLYRIATMLGRLAADCQPDARRAARWHPHPHR